MVWAVYILLLVTLRKVPQRASCKALIWDKVNTIRRVCIAPISNGILVSFGLTDQSPWSWLRQKGMILFASLRWPLGLWPREQAFRSQMNKARAKLLTNFDLVWKQGLCLSANRVTVHPGTRIWLVQEESQEVFICQQAEFFQVIWWYFWRLCVAVDSRISTAKVCDCVISARCWQVCGRVVELLHQNIPCEP